MESYLKAIIDAGGSYVLTSAGSRNSLRGHILVKGKKIPRPSASLGVDCVGANLTDRALRWEG